MSARGLVRGRGRRSRGSSGLVLVRGGDRVAVAVNIDDGTRSGGSRVRGLGHDIVDHVLLLDVLVTAVVVRLRNGNGRQSGDAKKTGFPGDDVWGDPGIDMLL